LNISIGFVVGETNQRQPDLYRAATWDGKTDPVRNILKPVAAVGFDLQQLLERVERWFKGR